MCKSEEKKKTFKQVDSETIFKGHLKGGGGLTGTVSFVLFSSFSSSKN